MINVLNKKKKNIWFQMNNNKIYCAALFLFSIFAFDLLKAIECPLKNGWFRITKAVRYISKKKL
jgi:hypothetical protein